MKRIILILAFAYSLAGCTPENKETFLSQGTEISLSWRGVTQVLFNERTGQIGYNDSRNEYRFYDDRLADWFTVKCSHRPAAEGENIIADVAWTGSRTPKTFKNLTFSIEKISNDGMIWMWNQANRIGIIIKDLQ